MARSNTKPNAFISIRVPSQDVREQLKSCQDEIVRFNPALDSTLVSLDKLHLTLMVIRLDGEEMEERCVLVHIS